MTTRAIQYSFNISGPAIIYCLTIEFSVGASRLMVIYTISSFGMCGQNLQTTVNIVLQLGDSQ